MERFGVWFQALVRPHGHHGQEDAPRILDLRFAILTQNARMGSLTIESGVTSLRRENVTAGAACLILRGKKIGYAAIGELLGGNTRQGNGPASAYCRVLPDIAA
jgi:hypothetical protein